jgi:oxygen-independent coproporphyrinogen-3 oxidase
MLGLYLHIPFCSAICNYCNFNRGLFDGALKARYVEALIAEIQGAGLKPCATTHTGTTTTHTGTTTTHTGSAGLQSCALHADTIFFGGGTPSLLEPAEVQRIIEACEQSFDVAADREVTLEANPESVTEERLAAYRAAGVNRLSFGAIIPDVSSRGYRACGAARARAAYAEARRAGFDNVSLDLMMWLPAQRLEEWFESIDAAIALGPEHLSLYLLEVYPNAPLKDDMARSRWSQAPDEDAAAMYLGAMDRLEAAGYMHADLNVARPGRSSRHGLKLTDGEWIALRRPLDARWD